MPRPLTQLAAGLSALGLLCCAGAAAATPTITVSVGQELAKKADRYGPRDVELIRHWLQTATERAMAKPGAVQPQRIDLVLENATPNRPTFEQMNRRPGLSFGSIATGGASITGSVTEADGSVRPVRYQWFETNLFQNFAPTTWTDAERAFNGLASRLAKGRDVDVGGPGSASTTDFGDFGRGFR